MRGFFHPHFFMSTICSASLFKSYTFKEVLKLIKYSNLYLAASLLLLLVNGSGLSFILFQVQLGQVFGIFLFCMTSLLGVLFASIASEKQSTYYTRLFFYGNFIVAFIPFYYIGVANIIS